MGFRYTAQRIAGRLPVTGYVKNLPTGQVELVAEGEEKPLHELVKALREAFHSYIRDVDIQWGNATEEYKDFGIRF